jgi:hypothetical protein
MECRGTLFGCVLPIVWETGWASRTWWQRVTLLPAVENRTSVEPVVTVWDIQAYQELHKNSIFVHQLADCRIYKPAGPCRSHPKQVTNDAKGRVCNSGSGAELWLSGDGTRFVLAAAIMSVGERASERESCWRLKCRNFLLTVASFCYTCTCLAEPTLQSVGETDLVWMW